MSEQTISADLAQDDHNEHHIMEKLIGRAYVLLLCVLRDSNLTFYNGINCAWEITSITIDGCCLLHGKKSLETFMYRNSVVWTHSKWYIYTFVGNLNCKRITNNIKICYGTMDTLGRTTT